MLDVNMTIIEVKRFMYEKLRNVWSEEHKIHESDEVLNEVMLL